MVLDIVSMHHIQAVQHADFHHAKPAEISRVFQITMAIVPTHRLGQRTSSMVLPERPRLGTVSRQSSKGNDLFSVSGHVFERRPARKGQFCNFCQKPINSSSLLSFGKSMAFECKYCHLSGHTKHFESDPDKLTCNPCPGEIEVRVLFFMAESEADQKRWIGKLTKAIKARGEKVAARAAASNTASPKRPSDPQLLAPFQAGPAAAAAAATSPGTASLVLRQSSEPVSPTRLSASYPSTATATSPLAHSPPAPLHVRLSDDLISTPLRGSLGADPESPLYDVATLPLGCAS